MSTARERQEKEKLDDCAKIISHVASNIPDNNCSHHDTHDLTKVITQLAESLEFISFREGTKLGRGRMYF